MLNYLSQRVKVVGMRVQVRACMLGSGAGTHMQYSPNHHESKHGTLPIVFRGPKYGGGGAPWTYRRHLTSDPFQSESDLGGPKAPPEAHTKKSVHSYGRFWPSKLAAPLL